MKKGVFFVLLLLIITGVTVQAGGLSEEKINTNNSKEYNLLIDLKSQLTQIEKLINIENTNITDNSSIQNEINDIKLQITKVENSNNFSNSTDGNYEGYKNRLENLEGKYIDVFAIATNINHWITIILFFAAAILGYTIWQKNAMIKYAEDEMDKLNIIVSKKEEELNCFKGDFERQIENMKLQANEDIKLVQIQYEEIHYGQEILAKKHNALEIKIKESDQRVQQDFIDKNNKGLYVNKNAIKYYHRGNEFAYIAKYKEAIEQYRKAILLQPDMSEAYNNIGIAFIELDKNKEAIIEFDNAIKYNENYTNAYSNKGIALSYLGDYINALKNQNKALTINKKDPSIYYNLACTYSMQNNVDKSVNNLEIALKYNQFINEVFRKHFYNDKDFDKIRGQKEFNKFEQKIKDKYGDNE